MKKKIFMLVAAMLISVTNVNALAQNNKCGDNAVFNYKDKVLTISGSGEIYDYSKENKPLWARYADTVEKIVISEGITSVGNWSFLDFSRLCDIELPKSLRNIGERSFYGCKGLEYIKIPEGVKSIEDGAFNGCVNAKRIDLPDSLEKIGISAFMNLPDIEVVTIGKNVEEIGNWAFFGCTSLKNVFFEGDFPQNMGYYVVTNIDDDYIIYYPDRYEKAWSENTSYSKEHFKAYKSSEKISVYLDNSEIALDCMSIIEEGRTLVPARAVLEAMGAEIEWDSENSVIRATRDNVVVEFKIASKEMKKNNEKISLEVAPKIMNNRTYIPVRAVSEAYGAAVSWNNGERAVYIDF